MIERVKQVVTEHKTAMLAILCILLVGIAYAVGRHSASEQTAAEKPAVMTQEQTQDAAALRAQLDISKSNAEALQRRLADVQAGQRAPTTTYYVSANSRACRAGSRAADQGGQSDTTTGGEGKDRSDGRHADHKGQGWQAVAN